MRESMKKLISLVACLTIFMTLAPIAMAQTAGIDALTIEDIIGHQPANMITSALTLSDEYTWTAEPAGVIDTDTGAVTRQAVEDKKVTLTAKIADTSKKFNLVVKSKKTRIVAADTFAYNYAAGTNAMTWDDFIFATQSTKDDIVHPIEVSDGNSYLTINWPEVETNGANYKWPYLRKNMSEKTGVLYFSFKYKYSGSSFALLKVTIGGQEQQAAAIGVNDEKLKFLSPWHYSSTGYAYSSYKHDGTDDWKLAVLKYDIDAGTIAISDDGITYKDAKSIVEFKEGADKTVSQIRICSQTAKGDCGKFMIDDFAIYTESFDNLTVEEREEYFESQITIENITDENAAAITKNLKLPTCDGSVTWTSSNENAIRISDEEGIVTRADNIAQTAILTAKYGNKSRVYNFAVSPTNSSADYKGNQGGYIILKDDFEYGTDNSTVDMGIDKDFKTYAGWARKTGETVPSFKYKNDQIKGMVGEITDEKDGKDSVFYLYAGNTGEKQRFETGFDVNVKKGSITIEMVGAVTHHKFIVDNNSLTVYEDTTQRTFEIDPGKDGWTRIDVDSNWAARSQNVYVDGVALTDFPMKNMIYTAANTQTVAGPALRSVTIKVSDGSEVCLDNFAIVSYEEDKKHIILADAGVKAAQLFYSDREVSAGTTLEKYGPTKIFGNAYNIGESLEGQYSTDTNRAALSYTGNEIDETGAFKSAAPGIYTIGVTAQTDIKNVGKATATGTVVIKGAPVVLKISEGKVSAVGNTANGVLLVASYDATGKFQGVKIEKENFTDIDVPEGEYRVFFFENLGNLVPLAFSK